MHGIAVVSRSHFVVPSCLCAYVILVSFYPDFFSPLLNWGLIRSCIHQHNRLYFVSAGGFLLLLLLPLGFFSKVHPDYQKSVRRGLIHLSKRAGIGFVHKILRRNIVISFFLPFFLRASFFSSYFLFAHAHCLHIFFSSSLTSSSLTSFSCPFGLFFLLTSVIFQSWQRDFLRRPFFARQSSWVVRTFAML